MQKVLYHLSAKLLKKIILLFNDVIFFAFILSNSERFYAFHDSD